ncbi:helicase-related protein, partial [Dysgonomonas termitidis]
RAIRQTYDRSADSLNKYFGEDAPQAALAFNKLVDNSSEAELKQELLSVIGDERLDDNGKRAIVEYVTAYSAYSGINKAKQEDIQQAEQQMAWLADENINPQMNAVVSAVIAGNGNPVQVTGGNIVQREDGSIDSEASDKQIFYVDAEGNKQVTSIDFIESIGENIPAQDAIAQLIEIETANIISRQENEEVREYLPGETVTADVAGNGITFTGEVTGITQSGNYIIVSPVTGEQVEAEPRRIINQDNIQGVENGSLVEYRNDKGERVQGTVNDAYGLRPQGMMDIDGNGVPVADIIGLVSQSTVNSKQLTQESDNLQATTPESADNLQATGQQNKDIPAGEQDNLTPTGQIPKDEKGNLLFEQAPVEATIGALSEVYNDTAELSGVVDATIGNIRKQIDKAKAPKPTGDINKDIAGKRAANQQLEELNNRLSYWEEVRKAIQESKPLRQQITGQLTGEETPVSNERINNTSTEDSGQEDSPEVNTENENIQPDKADTKQEISPAESETNITPAGEPEPLKAENQIILHSISSRKKGDIITDIYSGVQYEIMEPEKKGLSTLREIKSGGIQKTNPNDRRYYTQATDAEIRLKRDQPVYLWDIPAWVQFVKRHPFSEISFRDFRNALGREYTDREQTAIEWSFDRTPLLATPEDSDRELIQYYNDKRAELGDSIFTPDSSSVQDETAGDEAEKFSLAFGANNKLVSTERYEELKKRMRDKLNNLNAGIDPELFAIGAEMAVYNIEAGARKFADFAGRMIDDLGDNIRPYLKAFYEGARQMPGMETIREEMDSFQIVNSFDVDNLTIFEEESNTPNTNVNETNSDNRSDNRIAENGRIPAGHADADVPGGTTGTQTDGRAQSEQRPAVETENVEQRGRSGRSSGNNADSSGTKLYTGGTSRDVYIGRDDTGDTRYAGQTLNTNNNRQSREENVVPRGNTAKINANIAAIKLAKRLIETGKKATPEQMNVLRRYTGWGGLSSVFQQNDKNYKALQDLLTVEEYDSARASTTTAFYTPPEVTASVWDMIEKLGFKGGNILEPSAGIGNFFALMPESISNVSRLRGVELDTVSGSILKLLYPDANINISGFEKQRIANNSMDLVISNVPFGNFKVYDSNNKDISTGFDIHDYFIAKSVRTLKAGGIGVFITTSSTLDKSSALRNWVINNGNADFIDAVRLNTDTFKNDAGTEATADIIIVRKRDVNGISPYARNMQDSVMEREATYTIQEKNQWGYNTGEVEKKARMVYNKYFLDNPTRMAGEMKFGFEGGNAIRPTEQRLAPVKAINQQEVINRMIDELPGNIYNTTPASDTSKAVANNGTKEGGLTIIDGQAYIIQYNEAIPVDWNSNKAAGYPKTEILKDYLDIKESIDLLLEAEHNNDANIDTYRKNLNKVYDNFVKKYGALNENKKINFLQDDIDFPSVSAIENIEDGKDGEKTITKSDIFSKRVIDNQIEPKADNVEDAVRVSINQNGKVDIPYIARLLHKTNEEVQSEIVSKRIGFVNPETGLIEARNQYLSGNVRDKLSIAQQANQDNEYDSNIEELSKVIPADIPINLIKLTLGSTWVPTNVYEDFFKETFDVNAKLTKTSTDKYIGKISGKNNARDIQMGMPEASGSTLALNAMNNATTTISMQVWEDGKRKTVTDPLKTTQAAAKQTEIAETFEAWVKQKKEYHEELENIYNNTFNAVVNSAVDVDSFDRFPGVGGKVVSLGSKELENGKELHQYRVAKENTEADNELVVREAKSLGLKLDPETGIYSTHLRGDADVFFKKLNGTAKILRQHQKEGVIRGLESATLLAHEVGTGKTLTLITIAMEMRRLGLAKKPAIIVQRSTYKQFVKEIKNQYPNAKVLAPSEKDLTAKQRQQLFAKIAYNDWDIVVLYHSYLDSIPDNPQRVAQYIDEKISEKMDLLAEMERAKEDGAANAGRMMGALKKEIERLERDRDNTLNPDIEEESDTPTKSKRKRSVKDIEKVRSNAEAKAEKSLDRRTDNTMTFEQLGIDALLIDEAHAYKKLGFVTSLQRVKGIDTAESKRAQSTRLKSSYILENRNGKNVVLATGTPISNTMAEMWTFMRYLYPRTEMGRLQMNNFDAFVNNFGSIEESAEFGSNGKFRITNRFSSYSNVPELIAAWRQVTHTVLTEEVSTLKEGVGTPRVEGGKPADIMLEQTPPLKSVMKAIRNKLEEFDRMSGAEKKENSYIPLVMFGLAKRAAIDVRLVDPDLPDHPDSKLNRTVAEVVQDLKDTQSYKGTVAIFCDSYQSSDKAFNVFREIKQKLVDNGIPAGQVAIINDFDKDDAREKLFIAVNKGDVRVVLGTTEKLGVGVNIQERLHMAVHMDAPLRPSDYQQRNGRIMRQGNTHLNMDKTIKILRVGVQKTLDVTGYQRLEIKKKFIDQIMKGDVSQRMLEEADIESTDSSNFNQMMANLSGSQAALALSIEQNKLKKLQNARQYHEDNQVYMAGAVRRAKSIIVGNGQAIERFEEYRKELQRLVPDGKITTISIGKVSANTPEDIDIVLNQHITKRIDKEAAGLREDFLRNDAIIRNSIAINGIKVDLVVNITRNYDTDTKKTRITKEIFYTTPDVKLHNPLMSDPKNILPVFEGRAGANIQNVIDDINDLLSGYDIDKGIQKYKLGIDKAQRDIDAYEPQIGQPFAKEKELRATEEKVKDLNAQMEAELKQIEEAEAKEDVEAIDIDGIVEKNIEDTPESDTRIQASSGNFESIPAEKFNSLIDTLNQTGLAVEVVLDENIRSNPEIKDTQGNVYGYVTPDGVIYLDATRINANTPVHEFGHLWNSFIKENNPELWKKGVELIRQSPYYRECIYNNPAYSGLPEERKIDEALAMAIGDKGEKTVNSEQLTVNKLKVWLKDVWNVIKKAFGFNTDMAVEDMSLSDFTDRAVKDLFGGERLTNPGKNNNFGESKNNNNTRYGRRAETGLDNPGTMGRSAISGLVAEPEKRSGISKVIAAVNTAGSVSTIYDAEELEELEARGIDPYFDKTVFRKVLKDRARQNNVWFDKDYLNDKILLHDQKQTGTSENDVYLNPDGNTLTKLNNLSYVKGTGHKNNMAALVDRLSAHNALFPNIVYTIKGFMDNKNGFPSLVTEQPYIKNIERNATQEEIDGFLTEHGFKKDGVRDWSNGHEVWSNGKYELFDVRPANVLMGKDGNLYFIDTVPHSVGYMNDSKNTEAISKQELSEMEQIKQLSVNNSTFMKAPNGEPTNLNERQWLQVRTANFKNWFGDWENDPGNASKVIDENGEPLVVYHGTKNGGWTTPYIKGQPVFFTSNKETAKGYAKKYHTPVKEDIPVKNYPHKKYAVNYGVFLNIREHDNPAEFNAGKKSYNSYAIPLYNPMTGSEGLGGLDDMARNVVYEQRPYIIRNIYDNKDYNENDLSDIYIVPFANGGMIKSATDNTGSFDPADNDIRFQSVSDIAIATNSAMTAAARRQLDGRLKN